MAWTAVNPVAIGAPTKKSDYDKLWDNCDYFKTDHNTDGTHEKLTLGSDADGDMYYRAASVLARLAKGAADIMLGMNDDATAPAYKTTFKVTDAGIMTNTGQPCFLAYNSATDADVTGDGTSATVDFDTEVFDVGGIFALDTFTAPVSGKYSLFTSVRLEGLEAGDVIDIDIITSNRTYGVVHAAFTITAQQWNANVLADMDAADTAYVRVTVLTGDKDVDIYGGSGPLTSFGGALIC
jgi:hypothetical protein